MTPPHLRVIDGGDDGEGSDRWCLHCTAAVEYRAVTESWVHEATQLAQCQPGSDDSDTASVAPEGMVLRRRSPWGQPP